MTFTRYLIIILLSLSFFVSFEGIAGGPDSEIFQCEDPKNVNNLRVKLEGTTQAGMVWSAESISEEEVPFLQDLFQNPEVMKFYAGGKLRDRENTRQYVESMAFPRFRQGQPHGDLIVKDEKGVPIGHIVAGDGDEAGVSEIAYSLLPQYWNQKVASSILFEVVETWGPTVRQIGLGLDTVYNSESAVSAFCCFGETDQPSIDKILKRFDATASPKNPGSWKILDKTGFGPAQFKLDEKTETLDFKGMVLPEEEIDGKIFVDYQPLEDKLLPLFDIRIAGHRNPDFRYALIDDAGLTRTFSIKFDVVKYHFERIVLLENEIK